MELSKQEMELFLPLPGIWSKNFFYKMFLICSEGFKINSQNRKWNHPNRKRNYFSYLRHLIKILDLFWPAQRSSLGAYPWRRAGQWRNLVTCGFPSVPCFSEATDGYADATDGCTGILAQPSVDQGLACVLFIFCDSLALQCETSEHKVTPS